MKDIEVFGNPTFWSQREAALQRPAGEEASPEAK